MRANNAAEDSRMQLLVDGTVLEVNRDVTELRTLAARQETLARDLSTAAAKFEALEAALRESEQRLRWSASIIESSDDAIVSINLDGIITSWNRGAARIFGYTADEAIGQPITIVIPQDRQDEERAILTRLRRGERIDHFETVRQNKQGSLIVVSLTVSPVKNAEGKIIGASKIARDITAQKRSQEQNATLAREAEHRSKNLLASVQATVNLSRAETAEGLKSAIEGRIRALANVHSLFAETRWIGAELSNIVTHRSLLLIPRRLKSGCTSTAMLDEGRPDLVVAFPGHHGTADIVRRARAAGVKVRQLGFETA